ncbi:hypothetical protein JCM11641_003003 [Rhodosporidiobolus odoratus]
MARRPAASPLPTTASYGHASSSSTFGHSTPALSRHSSDLARPSSSPAPDVIATPSDRYDASFRSTKLGTVNGKPGARRSVRVRTSSGGMSGGGSSPQPVGLHSGNLYLVQPEHLPLHQYGHQQPHQTMPSRSRAIRTTATPGLLPPPATSNPPTGALRSRQTRPLPLDLQSHTDAFAIAQRHGYSVEQFEAAKREARQSVRLDGDASHLHQHQQQPHSASYTQLGLSHLHHHPYSIGGADGSPSYSTIPLPPLQTAFPPPSAKFNPYQPQPHQPPSARTPTSATSLQSAIELDAPFQPVVPSNGAISLRTKPSFDDVMSRSTKRQKTLTSTSAAAAEVGPAVPNADAMRQWAQMGDSSSSSSSDEEGPGLASMLSAHRRGLSAAGLGGVAGGGGHGGLLPSPVNLGRSSQQQGQGQGQGVEASPSAGVGGGRGAMDRFIFERAPTQAAAPEASVPQLSSTAPPPSVSTLPLPASPVRKPMSYPAPALLSPSPSKAGAGPGVLFSRDVARLLRSELDEMEANEVANESGGRRGSPMGKRNARAGGKGLDEVDLSSDIVVDDSYSSPYRRGIASPFSSAGASRTRDIFSTSADESAAKRARWNAQLNLPGSPTPSHNSISLSMKAPSFCDSSPTASDRGSVASRTQPALNSYDPGMNPASAPDFLYGAVPSSSPTSSQHSEYMPARYSRSSPGPHAASSLSVGAASSSPAKNAPVAAPRPVKTFAIHNTSYGRIDPNDKPKLSYNSLIGQALLSVEGHRMALSDIYAWVMKHYPYFKKTESGWQNSIRHNLSITECFIKTARSADNPGKGNLWQIKEGSEDQFVDGEFVKKPGQTAKRVQGGKKGKRTAEKMEEEASEGSSVPSSAVKKKTGERKKAKKAHGSEPVSRAYSPALSVASSVTESIPPPTTTTATVSNSIQPYAAAVPPRFRSLSPASSLSSAQSYSPPPSATSSTLLPAPAVSAPLPVQPTFSYAVPTPPPAAPQVPVQGRLSVYSRPASSGGFHRTESMPQLSAPAMLSRSHSSMGFVEQPHERPFQAGLQIEEEVEVDEKQQRPKPRPFAGAAPPMSRTMSLPALPVPVSSSASTVPPTVPASPPPARQSARFEPVISRPMSPPTAVYRYIAGPYRPMFSTPRDSRSSAQRSDNDRRAMALLQSPEAAGIMAEEKANGEKLGGVFLGMGRVGQEIFGGARGKRSRTESEKSEAAGGRGMLSPGALVHTQSPVSSLRGGPRQPMSPVQNSSEKLEACPDPEKKLAFSRTGGTRLLPAVNALASTSTSSSSPSLTSSDTALFDPFRSPPPSSFKAHLRSPSTSFRLLSTPGGSKGRMPLGYSPSLAGGAWGVNHPSSSSRSSAWEDPFGAAETELEDGQRGFAWPSTPGMMRGKEW